FSKPVTGWTSNFVGQLMCSSGAVTGAVCDLKIQAVGLTFAAISGQQEVRQVVVADQLQGAGIATHGDSGGPVFGLDWQNPNPGSRVLAGGQMFAGEFGLHSVTCPNGLPGCTSELFYVDI